MRRAALSDKKQFENSFSQFINYSLLPKGWPFMSMPILYRMLKDE